MIILKFRQTLFSYWQMVWHFHFFIFGRHIDMTVNWEQLHSHLLVVVLRYVHRTAQELQKFQYLQSFLICLITKFLPPIQLATKILFQLVMRRQVIDNIKFLSNVYEENVGSSENWPIFDRFIKILSICIKLLIGEYLVCSTLCILFPGVYYLATNLKMLIAPIFLPAMSIDSPDHFAFNIIDQVFRVYLAAFILILFDTIFTLQMLHVILLTNILRHKIRAINEISVVRVPSSLEIMINLKNVVKFHVEWMR